ncbi:hypothetical protein HPQ64_07945 [Rhizobiales bacterium]|uniref:argonaute/piwi family protein n=1 Tax=Hongsoonwoonella zoysiae TaxID=2821844 RepID=UPI00155FD3AF|nr:hypothetical protein [Hongsoonwoonella zoysiae]NRG17616.1 hypothetical protein [Hongsoonwoonella zoysiae]
MTEFRETSLAVIHIDEPQLEFGHGQVLDHPKDGLYLYGPNRVPKRHEISVGLVATKAGEELFRNWLSKAQSQVRVPKRKKREKSFRPHLSDFPGLFEAYGISVDADDLTVYNLNTSEIEDRTVIENHHEAVARTVDLFLEPIENHLKNEEKTIDVWVFSVPETVFDRCRVEASGRRNIQLTPGAFSRKQKAKADLPLLANVIDTKSEAVFEDVPDFHRQIKARLLKIGQPCQLVRETTLAPDKFLNRAGNPIRGVQDPATIAWNLATALFYKSQEYPPWKIAEMREGVCYIGLVFKLLPNHPDNHACCAAQMFLSEGDGVVFRGANGPWMTERKEFHLSKEAARKLIDQVLKTYRSKFGSNPKELFIHGRTKFTDEEWEAFSESAPEETNIVAIRIKSTHGETKFYRDGDYPTIRGTALLLGLKDAYLWTSGYVPRIDTYLGPETPNPLFITVLRASSELPDISTVLHDVMRLTKINFNSASYNDGLPVTIRFADKVGEVLVMGSAKDAERQPFKFYI